jgi:hypothetical protein
MIALFEVLKPNSQETAQNSQNVLQMWQRITFYTYIPVNPLHFLKKQHNRCTSAAVYNCTTNPFLVFTHRLNIELFCMAPCHVTCKAVLIS